MPYEFGTIVVVPFPFTDQSASKRRPAVVVTRECGVLGYFLAARDVRS